MSMNREGPIAYDAAMELMRLHLSITFEEFLREMATMDGTLNERFSHAFCEHILRINISRIRGALIYGEISKFCEYFLDIDADDLDDIDRNYVEDVFSRLDVKQVLQAFSSLMNIKDAAGRDAGAMLAQEIIA